MRTIDSVALALLIAFCSLAGCNKTGSSTAQTSEAPGGGAPAAASPSAPAATSGAAKPFNVGSIFPPGPGRDLVLNTCGSCHPVVCVARGQRTAERWDSIQRGHKDKLTNTSSDDLKLMFFYLKANFNEAKPEPEIPPELAQQGCTPF